MITSSYPRHSGDGAGAYVGYLARALVDMQHVVHVVAPDDPDVASTDEGGVIVHRYRYAPCRRLCVAGHGRSLYSDTTMKRIVPLLMPAYVLAGGATALDLHRRHRFDIIHGHWAVPGGFIASMVSRVARRALIMTLHGSDVYVTERNRLYAAAARMAYRQAACVTAVSDDLRRRAVAVGLPEAISRVVPSGVDGDMYARGDGAAYRLALGIAASAPVVGALGRLVGKKGFEYLIDAMPRVLAAVPDAVCVIGGEGDLADSLRASAAHLGLHDRVMLAGQIPRDETASFYAMCDVFAVPSVVDPRGNVDGLPLVLLEAMASGVPVVGSRLGGVAEVISDGENGLLVPPGDSESLAEKVIQVLQQPEWGRSLGQRARRDAEAGYSWKGIAGQFEAIYGSAMAQPGRVSHV